MAGHRIRQLDEDIKAKFDETRVSEMIKEANIEHKSDEVINEVKEVVKDQTMKTKEREKYETVSSSLTFMSQIHNLKHDMEMLLELCTEINKDFVDTDISEIRRL